ncbi:MAG TPA: MarR family transcriptional regulator [Nocardioidaceae bacterium]|jgi:DNA-binding MarR family transcriptional regulator
MRDWVDEHVEQWADELPWMDPIKEAIFVRVGVVARHANLLRRRLDEADELAHWKFKVLITLRGLGPPYTASPSEIAGHLGLSRGALSNRLGVLEAEGLLTRTVDRQDRRRVHVTLTDAGHAAFEKHASNEEGLEQQMLEPLTAAEKKTLARLLRKIVVGIESRS